MAIAFTIFLIFCICLIIGLGIYAIILKQQSKEDYEDNPFILNFATKFAPGRAFGVQKSITVGRNGRLGVTYSPRDVHPDNFGMAKDQTVIVDRNKIISLAKGTWSNEKNINILLPPKAEDFPDHIKNTFFGKALGITTEIINAANSEAAMKQEGIDRRDALLKEIGDGELSREQLTTVNELVKDIAKMTTDIRNKDKSSGFQGGFNPVGGSSSG